MVLLFEILATPVLQVLAFSPFSVFPALGRLSAVIRYVPLRQIVQYVI